MGKALGRMFVSDGSGDAVVINHMVGAHVLPEMVLHGGVGMGYRHLPVYRVSGHNA